MHGLFESRPLWFEQAFVPCLLAGDSEACLVLLSSALQHPQVWSCAPRFGEIDLLHASPEALMVSGRRWSVVVAGTSPTHSVLRYLLTTSLDGTAQLDPIAEFSLDGAALGMSWAHDASQGVVGTTGGSLWHLVRRIAV